MYTDPKRVRADIPGTVEGNPVFMYHDAFNPDTAEVDDLKTRYRAGKVGDVEVKTKLAKALNAHLEPMRARRAERAREAVGRCARSCFEGSRKAARDRRANTDGAGARTAVKLRLLTRGLSRMEFEFDRLEALPGQARPISKARSICCCTSFAEHEVNIYDIPIVARHAAVPRLHRPDAGAEPRRRGGVPGDGGDADPHQVAHAAAARRSDAGRSRTRIRARRWSAGCSNTRNTRPRRSCCTSARRCGARSGRGRTARSPRSPARRPSRRSKSISSA